GAIALAVMMNLLVEPCFHAPKLAAPEVGVEIAEIMSGLLHQLRCVEIAERVRRKITEAAEAPVNILQAALAIIRRCQAESFCELLIPGTGTVGRLQFARDQSLFQLET